MVDYSIELAHIYSDEKIGDEQISSLEEGVNFINKLKETSKTFSVSLLIDNYNASSFTVNETEMIDLAKKYGVSIDFIVHEAVLADLCDLLVRDIDPGVLKKVEFVKSKKDSLVLKHDNKIIGIRDYLNSHYKNTCAALIACWQLARLSVYEIGEDKMKRVSDRSFQGKKTLTVLPEKYRTNEDKALVILQNTKHKDLLKNIEYIFF